MKKLFLAFIASTLYLNSAAQVMHAGAMKDMAPSGFAPTISLDSLKKYKDLIALGPLGRMQGEITAVDGKVYLGKSNPDGSVNIDGDWEVEAPFLVYADIPKWEKAPIEGHVNTIAELEAEIVKSAVAAGVNLEEPFFFRITGVFDQMTTHIVTPRSAEIAGYVAGQNQKNFDHKEEKGELIGVYSKTGQRIYTHHDSFMHVHFLTDKKDYTGHLDQFSGDLSELEILFPKARISVQ